MIPQQYDKRVSIERQPEQPKRAQSGAPIDSWRPVGERWAAAVWKGGREFLAAHQVNSETEALFELASPIDGLSVKDRLVWRDRVFHILSVDTITDSRHPRLSVKEGKSLR